MITDDLLPMLDDPTFSDEDLAKLADVPVAEIAAARAKKAALLAALEPPAAKPTRGARTKPAEPTPAPAPEPVEVEAPANVRVVVAEARVALPGARAPVRITYRDVYGGPTAAYLWAHHRHLVEPYGA